MSKNITDSKIFAWPAGQHEEVRARIATHRAAGEITQKDGSEGKCIIECSLGKYSFKEYAQVFGVSLEVAHLVDCIHEDLPRELALNWPARVAMALRPGAETTYVWPRFAVWLLREKCGSCIAEKVACLYERRMQGDEPLMEEWKDVEIEAARETTVTALVAERAAMVVAQKRPGAAAWAAWRAADQEIVPFPQQADILINILVTSP